MRILIAGDWHSNIHEEACLRAFKKLGHKVFRFSWFEYFNRYNYADLPFLDSFRFRFQNRFVIGPVISRINSDLIKLTARILPDVVFIYRGTHIRKDTIIKIKNLNKKIVITGFMNDDPFSGKTFRFMWRHFKKALPSYDINFIYRQGNFADYEKSGAQNIYLLRSYFIPERNHHVNLLGNDMENFGADVVFVGHYEKDGREKYLEEIVKKGFRLKLFGSEWDSIVTKSEYLKRFYPVRLAWDEEYNKALCGSKIALCFLSKLNRDTYTRRCFEIPSTKTFMLSEYSDDLNSMFAEGKEAEYFRDKKELIDKISFYLKYPDKRNAIARAGYKRLIRDGHDVVSRMRYSVGIIQDYIDRKKFKIIK